MDKLNEYRNSIEEVLNWYGQFQPRECEEYERQVLFDRERDHYLVLDVGWDYPHRIYNCLVHLDIKGGKIWVQEDVTDPGVVGRLMDRGIPREDIVLAFHAPYKRPYTEFAAA